MTQVKQLGVRELSEKTVAQAGVAQIQSCTTMIETARKDAVMNEPMQRTASQTAIGLATAAYLQKAREMNAKMPSKVRKLHALTPSGAACLGFAPRSFEGTFTLY